VLFNSLHFLIFFPLVTAVYFALQKMPHRRTWLLAAGWYFYAAWKPEFLVLLIVSTLTDYFAGLNLEKSRKKSKRIAWLLFSLTVNLGILFVFKYFVFIDYNLDRFLDLGSGWTQGRNFENLLLPVGISFYTFQTISYTIDVFRRQQKAERNFIKFALFVSFFPQLVAGPIERASQLLPQFNKKAGIDYARMVSGLKLMFWGFFQKLVIADNMAPLVDTVYSNPQAYYGLDVILATFFFSVQIYCDFSGYTDIARGASRIMGFELRLNFTRPYFAKSIAEFWRRWHISLSSWFRDYVYIPLGGSRVNTRAHWAFNILITFVLSGIWHGAGWNFIIWGMLHGLFYLSERLIRKPALSLNIKLAPALKMIFVFALVNFAWVFFRSESVSIAFSLIKNSFLIGESSLNFDRPMLFRNFLLIIFLLIVQLIERRQNIVDYVSSRPFVVRWAVYYLSILIMLFFGNFGINEFIYFRF
jgi:D-alanyl-lipoteichoic acid acyltransferase DltB (MBOAT superfamily)